MDSVCVVGGSDFFHAVLVEFGAVYSSVLSIKGSVIKSQSVSFWNYPL